MTIPPAIRRHLERRLANRQPMTDEQRRAMHARMRGTPRDQYSARRETEADKMRDTAAGRLLARDTSPRGKRLADAQAGALADLALSGWQTGLGAGALPRATVARLMPWIKTAGTAGAAAILEDIRKNNPTMSPGADKALALAEQALEYSAAISGIGAARGIGKKVLEKTGGKYITAALGKAGAKMDKLGRWIKSKIPAKALAVGGKAYNAYDKIAELTGVTIKDLAKVPGIPAKMAKVNTLVARRAAAVVRGDLAAVQRINKAIASIQSQVKSTLVSSGIITAGAAAKLTAEEMQIARLYPEAKAKLAAGEAFEYDAATPSGALELAGRIAVGTTGNALEKQFRTDTYPAQTAAYRAIRDLIDEAEAAGTIDADKAEKLREDAAERKPWNMAGKSLWTFAPALASYLSYQGNKLADEAERSTITTVSAIRDADTIETPEDPKGVRFASYNAPEIPHPEQAAGARSEAERNVKLAGEPLGQEATEALRKYLKEGQTVRIVADSNDRAAEVDKYGRPVRYVETLPTGLNWLLDTPVGKYVPAKDLGLELTRQGMGDDRYQSLSGTKTDRSKEYTEARKEARDAGRGVWQPDIAADLGWVGKAKNYEDPDAALPAWTKAVGPAGLGLMATGNAGVFSAMGQSAGGAAAKAYNALLAVSGAAQQQAESKVNKPLMILPPRGLPRTATTPKSKAAEERAKRMKLRQDA